VRKALALIMLGAVATVAAGVALATPGEGITVTPVARGTLAPHFKIKLRDSSKPGDVAVQQVILTPGGHSGWHAHPGPALVLVKSGEVTFTQADDCSSTTYTAGQVAVESAGDGHRARNTGATNAEIWVTFLDVPVGSSARIEVDDPGC
jgi:quercetin dioxygenase-like cupin family protein